jgi:hypothetical protein
VFIHLIGWASSKPFAKFIIFVSLVEIENLEFNLNGNAGRLIPKGMEILKILIIESDLPETKVELDIINLGSQSVMSWRVNWNYYCFCIVFFS